MFFRSFLLLAFVAACVHAKCDDVDDAYACMLSSKSHKVTDGDSNNLPTKKRAEQDDVLLEFTLYDSSKINSVVAGSNDDCTWSAVVGYDLDDKDDCEFEVETATTCVAAAGNKGTCPSNTDFCGSLIGEKYSIQNSDCCTVKDRDDCDFFNASDDSDAASVLQLSGLVAVVALMLFARQ
eukprot:553510_1